MVGDGLHPQGPRQWRRKRVRATGHQSLHAKICRCRLAALRNRHRKLSAHHARLVLIPCDVPNSRSPRCIHGQRRRSLRISRSIVQASVPPSVRLDRLGSRPHSSPPPSSLPSTTPAAPSPSLQTPSPQNAGRPCRFGAGASETTPG